MSLIQVFDPPMCCSTGVCGPSVDPELARFAADLDWLRAQGIGVERFNLALQPGAFAEAAAVRKALEKDGNGCLPLIVVAGRIVSRGAYPERTILAALAGLTVREAPASAASGCCGSSAAGQTRGDGCC